MDHPDLKAETEAILTEGGALAAIVTQEGDAWTVSAAFPCRGYAADGRDGMSGKYGPKPYTGNTRRTGGDPRDLAAHFVADAAAHRAKMDAFFAPPAPVDFDKELEEHVETSIPMQKQWEHEPAPAEEVVADEGEAGQDSGDGYAPGNPSDGEPLHREEPAEAGVLDEAESSAGGAIDADFGELDAPDTDASFLIENRPDDIEVEEPVAEPGSQFIFGDNLATDRLVRQGQIVDVADRLIQETRAAVTYDADEFANLQGEIVSNLDAAGSFTGDPARYQRFVELSDAQSHVRQIEQERDTKVSFIRTAEREAVATFDPEADWPLF